MVVRRLETSSGHVEDLVEQAGTPYLFVKHTLEAFGAAPFRTHPDDYRSFLVLSGQVQADDWGRKPNAHGYLEGWHAPPGSVYRLRNPHPRRAVVLEAGSACGQTREAPQPSPSRADLASVSGYTVTKPWGFEVWYTENLPNPRYALKRIHMTAGRQSSLQSHRHKAETNYVIEGEATVLNGLLAPDDPDAVVDPAELPVSVHRPGSGWSSAPGVLHRVIARSDYTSIEVSTPELDDVIRWRDDAGRGDGRIEAEHETDGR